MSTKHGKVSVIIPVYISTPRLIVVVENLLSDLRIHYPEFEVITVDDASPIDHPVECTLTNGINRGFTATVNRGLDLATGDILVVMNEDIVIKAGDLDTYLVMDGRDRHIVSIQDSAGTADTTFGAIWGMTRSVYNELGGLDERCAHYFSDKLYYRKALAAGIMVQKVGSVIIDHYESMAYKTVDKDSLFEADRVAYESVLLDDGNTVQNTSPRN